MTSLAKQAPVRGATNSLLVSRLRDLALLPAILVLMIVGVLVSPSTFLTPENLINVLQQQTELSLLVLAEALVLIAGRFDLSLESTIGLAPALGLLVATYLGLPGIWTIPICLLVGVLVGLLNGLLVVRGGLNAFIVTLGMLIVLRGGVIGFTGGKSLFNAPPEFFYLGSASWLWMPASIWICAVIFAIGMITLGFFRGGRSLYAVGGNVDAARAAGIRADRVLLGAFVVASFLAALAGLMLAGRLGSVAANQGSGMIFTVFAAAVIGGISLDGGRGTLFGALCGVIVLGLIQNILVLAGVSAQWNQAIYGVIILIALVLARLTSGKSQN
ncbi:ABC transporter permease [Fodinicola acaciae]|uniref:ABC transporter permease n=1 Tax=Fodinicola acaciae TaxID=2681555 RepID=UPI001C9E7079|nr:ABC transporter permease [Fodinicola acaciae]